MGDSSVDDDGSAGEVQASQNHKRTISAREGVHQGNKRQRPGSISMDELSPLVDYASNDFLQGIDSDKGNKLIASNEVRGPQEGKDELQGPQEGKSTLVESQGGKLDAMTGVVGGETGEKLQQRQIRQEALLHCVTVYMDLVYPTRRSSLKADHCFHELVDTIEREGGVVPWNVNPKDIQNIVDNTIKKLRTLRYLSKDHIDPQSIDFLDYYHSDSNRSQFREEALFKLAVDAAHEAAYTWDSCTIRWKKECIVLVIFLELAYTNRLTLTRTFIDSPQLIELHRALDAKTHNDIVLEEFLATFQDKLIDSHWTRNISATERNHYARGVALLQSSGSGKSRLLRQAGLRVASFAITLAANRGSRQSVPCPDDLIIDYLKEYRGRKLGHHVVAALLSAIFKELYIFIAAWVETEADKTKNLIQILYNTSPKFRSEEMHEKIKCYNALDDESKSYIDKHIKDRHHSEICECIQKLRSSPDGSGRQEQRNQFLNYVVRRANAYLRRIKQVNIATEHTLHYLDKDQSSLCENIEAFFSLLDQSKDGKKRKLSKYAETDDKFDQFIFGVDECRHSFDLLPALDRRRSDIPQGVTAFLRVFRDLEVHAIESSKKDRCEPTRRVWIALLDTSSSTELLPPEIEADKIKVSGRTIPRDERVISHWIDFGMDHLLRDKLTDQPSYMDDLTIGQLHHFDHLKLTGRGMWHAHSSPLMLELSVPKLVLHIHDHDKIPLFMEKYSRENFSLDPVTYAVASLRFGLDTGLLAGSDSSSMTLVTESIAKHMRVLIRLAGEESIQTTTPSEPILAATALILLNYSQSVFKQWGPISSMMDDDEKTGWLRKDKDNRTWRNMLKELGLAFTNSRKLVNVGDDGELIGRIILSRARDCTLPAEWNPRKHPEIPYTTLGEYIEQLIGKSEADLLYKQWIAAWKQLEESGAVSLEKHWCARVWGALVNFNQFVPYASPVHEDEKQFKVNDGIPFQTLRQGFDRGIGYICIPNTPGTDLKIPIMVATVETYELLLSNQIEVKDTKVTDWLPKYVGVQEKWKEGAEALDSPLFSWHSIGADGKLLDESAVLLIFMDQGTKEPFTLPDQQAARQIRRDIEPAEEPPLAKVISEWVAGGVEKQKKRYGNGYAYFFSLRIRGINSGYPCMRTIDEEDDCGRFDFEDSIREIMASRKARYKVTESARTIPRYYEQAADYPELLLERERYAEYCHRMNLCSASASSSGALSESEDENGIEIQADTQSN